jgi:hypothetical protein
MHAPIVDRKKFYQVLTRNTRKCPSDRQTAKNNRANNLINHIRETLQMKLLFVDDEKSFLDTLIKRKHEEKIMEARAKEITGHII